AAAEKFAEVIIDKFAKPLEKVIAFVEKFFRFMGAAWGKDPFGDLAKDAPPAPPVPPGEENLSAFQRWWKHRNDNSAGAPIGGGAPRGADAWTVPRSGGSGNSFSLRSDGAASLSLPGGGDPSHPGLAADRKRFADELKNNPALRDKVMAIAAGEN